MKDRKTVADSMAHEFRLLRNRIEAEIPAPALLFVTSATGRDGAALTAYGLAESLSTTNQRTVLVTSDPTVTANAPVAPPTYRRRASDRIDAAGGRADAGPFNVIAVSPERLATFSRSTAATFVQELREHHAFIVVDASNLPQNSFGLLLLASADAALIAFRSGRAQQPADRSMLDTLERAETKIFGAVLTDELAIDQFAQRGRALPVGADLPEERPATILGKRLEIALNRLGKSL